MAEPQDPSAAVPTNPRSGPVQPVPTVRALVGDTVHRNR